MRGARAPSARRRPRPARRARVHTFRSCYATRKANARVAAVLRSLSLLRLGAAVSVAVAAPRTVSITVATARAPITVAARAVAISTLAVAIATLAVAISPRIAVSAISCVAIATVVAVAIATVIASSDTHPVLAGLVRIATGRTRPTATVRAALHAVALGNAVT